MRNYELMMVIVPHLDDESFAATLGKLNVYIGDRGGNVVGQQRWGSVRRLAYPIQSYTEGSYVVTHFEIEPEHTNDLDASLMVSEDILRHILVKVDKFGPLPGAPSSAAPAADDSQQNQEGVHDQPTLGSGDSTQTESDNPIDSQEQDVQDEATTEPVVEEPETESDESVAEEKGKEEMEQQG